MKRASRQQQPEVKTLKLNYGDRSRLKLIPKARVGFPAEVCESERGDGERSRQRVRDQVARMALWGRDANEIERARISMMARGSKAPSIGRIQKRKTNFSKSSLSACNARPVHTDGPEAELDHMGRDAEKLSGARPLRRLPYMLLEHQYIEPIDKDTMAAAKVALRLLARERGGAERDAGF
jgi:hypothetical protein